MIKLADVRKSYAGKVVLNGIDLAVQSGEVVSILGGSGAGKSTIVNCINGLVSPDSGTVELDGYSVASRQGLREIRKKCATVFQNFNLYPHLTNVENITLAPVRVLGIDPEKALADAHELLVSVGLTGHADKYPAQLSGGQKQRIGICRALAMSPDYLLLDEITSALDPEMTADVIEVLKVLAARGMTMILVTHELSVAKSISSRIVFLDEGQIQVDVHKDEFFSEVFLNANPRIQSFVASAKGL
ncbi:MAG: amino acid ABC transporter ATP-binding protein [Woeseiaceae bacterium]